MVVPEGWRHKRLNQLVDMKSGMTITERAINDFDRYPCYGGNGLRGYTSIYTHDGDFALIGRQGALCGNVVFVSGKFFASEHAIVVTPSRDTDIKYVYYLLDDMRLNQYSESSAQPGLSVNKVLELFNLVANEKDEQTAIAEALSDADSLIASLEKLIAKKKAIKQGAIQELLTGKKRLPGFSGEWIEYKLGDIADIRTGKKNNGDKVANGKYPFFVRSQEVEKIDTYSFDGEVVLVPGEGNIGEIFHYMNGKFDYHQRVYKISLLEDTVSTKLLFYILKHSFGSYALQNTVKATVDSLRLPTFQKFTIFLAKEKAEQTAIASILSDMDAEIEQLEKKLAKYCRIKQGMMQELLTGRIRLVETKH